MSQAVSTMKKGVNGQSNRERDPGRNKARLRGGAEWLPQDDQFGLRGLRQAAMGARRASRSVMPYVQQQDYKRSSTVAIRAVAGSEESRLERRAACRFQGIHQGDRVTRRSVQADGAKERVCDAASSGDGSRIGAIAFPQRAGAPQERRPQRQSYRKSRTLEVIAALWRATEGLSLPRLSMFGGAA